jgi:hypothetical protein
MSAEKDRKVSFRIARSLCERIVLWHKKNGVHLLKKMDSPTIGTYLETLDALSTSDLNELATLKRIASLQRSGRFEFAYGQPLPGLDKVLQAALHRLQIDIPTTLGSAARLIEDVIEREYKRPKEHIHEYQLPNNWDSGGAELLPGHVVLRIGANETPRGALRRHFRQLAQWEGHGLGGRNVVVDMNEDLAAEKPAGDDQVVAYAPSSFGLALATGPNTLPTLLLHGAVTITVTLGKGEQTDAHVPQTSDKAE